MAESLIIGGRYLWAKKSKFLWVLDPGHGGVDKNGTYTTAPAKMFKHPDFTLFEGEINRKICDLVWMELLKASIDFAIVADEVDDTPLEERVRTADNIFRKDKRAVYVSIHSNSGGGNGNEIFTAPGQSESDDIARIFEKRYKDFNGFKWRGLKENNFYVLRKTDCPAILLENLFFDDYDEAKFLVSAEGQKAIADLIVNCIMDCEKSGLV